MSKAFHLSFAVQDLTVAKNFYQEIPGCEISRDAGSWFDVMFFGHQLTLHQATENLPTTTIDHFGPVLDKAEWLAMVAWCNTKQLSYVLPPVIKEQCRPTESGKFIIKDPAGNVLEFKY